MTERVPHGATTSRTDLVGAGGAPLVSARGVTKTFGASRALREVNLTVEEGQSMALLGRNGAGKSTLVSVLTGLYAPDDGALNFHGTSAPALADRAAWRANVACVYQHRTLVPQLSVAENLFLGDTDAWVNWRALHARATALLDEWELPIRSKSRVDELDIGDAQMVEIARALARGSRFVILDEPTAQLVSGEIDALHARVNALRARGVTFLYISHHLDEVPVVCDHVTVLRNGRDVLRAPVDELSTEAMVAAMVGDDSPSRSGYTGATRGPVAQSSDPVLRVQDVKTTGLVEPVTLDLRPGEVLGLAGHAGSGSRSFGLALAGHEVVDEGTIQIGSEVVTSGGSPAWRPSEALRHGVTLVPEDRIHTGLVPQMTIEDHVTFTVLGELGRGPLVSLKARRGRAEEARTEFGIACSSVTQKVSQLSGGNQQKVLLAAALASSPQVLILMHPTAGVDIASKATIMQLVEERRRAGLAVIIVSDEPEELEFCDTVHVFVRGSQIATVTSFSPEELVALMEGTPTTVGDQISW